MFLEVLKKTDPMIISVKYLYCIGILKLQLNCSKEFCLEHTINSIPIQFFYFFFAVTQGNERKCLVTSNEFTPFANYYQYKFDTNNNKTLHVEQIDFCYVCSNVMCFHSQNKWQNCE